MRRCLALLAVLAAFMAAAAPALAAPATEKRIALVVGNAAYAAGALATPANDAGLVAQTLQAAGFDVVGARDLDEDGLRRAFRDFTDKAAASGPDTVAFVYLAGYGLQLNGENYFAPIDARIDSAADVPVRALRISDYKRRLAALPLKARFVVLDAGRKNPFVKSGDPLAGGLALTEAEPGALVAFNAAPGTVGPEEKGPYGAYAQALVEMIREGGLGPAELFDRVRLRVSETTNGAEVPWDAARIESRFVFLQRAADAPTLAEPDKVAALEARPLREIGPRDAYAVCLQRDTVQGYQDFLGAYPRDPLARRVRALVAARREALVWERTYVVDTPDGYWSYLSRYPRGPHAWDARRRLRELAVALEPPPRFALLAYDLPPPPPEEIVYVERPYVYFADPVYDLPPPPPPLFFLPPRPAYIIDLAPPPPVYAAYVLPVPVFVPVPAYVSAPAYIAPPPNNIYFQNIHNTTVINEINQQTLAGPGAGRGGPSLGTVGAGAAGAALGAAAARVALPPGLAPGSTQRPALPANALSGGGAAGALPGQPGRFGGPVPNAPQALPGQRGPAAAAGLGQPLPGQNGQPLPAQQAARPAAPNPLPGGTTPGQALAPQGGPAPRADRRERGLAAVNRQAPGQSPGQPAPAFAPNPGPGRSAPPLQAARPERASPDRAGPDRTRPDRMGPGPDFGRQQAAREQAAQARERDMAQQRGAQQQMMQQQAAQQRAAAQQQMAQQRAMMQAGPPRPGPGPGFGGPMPRGDGGGGPRPPAPPHGGGGGGGGGHVGCHPGQPCR